MTTPPTEPTDPPTEADDDATGPDPAAESLPTERVNQLLARERKKAERKAKAELLETLGVESVDTLQETLAATRAREDAERSDLEKAQAAKAEADQVNADLAARLQRAELRQSIGEALAGREEGPVRPDRLKLAADLALTTAMASDDDDPVAAAIGFVFEQSPEWFTSSDDDETNQTNRTPNVRPKGPADRKPKGKSAAVRGQEAAAAFGSTFVPPMPPPSS